MKIRTQERSDIFETFEYEIPESFDFPLDEFLLWDGDQKLSYLQRNEFESDRIGWEYGDNSVLDSVDVID